MEKYSIANLPTKIEKLERFSKNLNRDIYIKRDDHTGGEFSGNKIRKLEYLLKDAVDKGCNMLITCGGIQSNHCRATAAIAARMGLNSALLLRISEEPRVLGNYFLDKLLGAKIKFCTREEYSNKRGEIMEQMAKYLEKEGYKPYIIPEGASNTIGTLGYYNCMQEIVKQEQEMGITFDTIVVATGSGGTYSGLYLANEVLGLNKKVIGMAVCDDIEYFTNITKELSSSTLKLLQIDKQLDYNNIHYIDKYVGLGYAISREEELEFIKSLAKLEGIILDPVYTGKAMYGLYNEINTELKDSKKILFIHTGGLYGLFPISETFKF